MLDELVIPNEEENLISEEMIINQLKEIVFENTSAENELRYAKDYANQIWALAKKNGWEMAEYFADMTRNSLNSE